MKQSAETYVTKGYMRDPRTNVVVNSDEREYKEYKLKMEIFKEINDLRDMVFYLAKKIEKLEEKK